MSDTPFSFIGQADAYIDILTDAGASTGLVLKGNCTKFTPKPNAETKELTGNGLSNFGQTIASVTIPKPMTASITFNEIDREMFAAAFFGVDTTESQAAGTMTDHAVVAIADKGVSIGKYLVSSVEVTDSGGVTTYVEGTDYTVHAKLGMITALSSGAIADGESLLVSCSHAAIGSSMEAMTKSNIRIAVKLDGKNFGNGREFITEIFKMKLSPSSDFSLIGTDFVEVTFEGTLETPSGGTTPLKHVWLS